MAMCPNQSTEVEKSITFHVSDVRQDFHGQPPTVDYVKGDLLEIKKKWTLFLKQNNGEKYAVKQSDGKIIPPKASRKEVCIEKSKL